MSLKLEEIENTLKQVEIVETHNQLDEDNTKNIVRNSGNLSCGDSIDSLNSNSSSELTGNQDSPTKEETALSASEETELINQLNDLPVAHTPVASSSLIKRSHLKSLIYEIYNLNEAELNDESLNKSSEPQILVEGFMEKLPPRKNLKNSILLAWKKRYFKLSSIGLLNVYDFNEQNVLPEPIESYNLMGARVVYEQNEIISLDDNRGSCVVFRCCESPELTSDQVNTNHYCLLFE